DDIFAGDSGDVGGRIDVGGDDRVAFVAVGGLAWAAAFDGFIFGAELGDFGGGEAFLERAAFDEVDVFFEVVVDGDFDGAQFANFGAGGFEFFDGFGDFGFDLRGTDGGIVGQGDGLNGEVTNIESAGGSDREDDFFDVAFEGIEIFNVHDGCSIG